MGTIQSVASLGNPVFLNHCICNGSLALKPHSLNLSKGRSPLSPEVPMNWLLVKGRVTRTYWRANSDTLICGTNLEVNRHDCWNVRSSGAGRKGNGAAERDAMGGKTDHGRFMSV